MKLSLFRGAAFAAALSTAIAISMGPGAQPAQADDGLLASSNAVAEAVASDMQAAAIDTANPGAATAAQNLADLQALPATTQDALGDYLLSADRLMVNSGNASSSIPTQPGTTVIVTTDGEAEIATTTLVSEQQAYSTSSTLKTYTIRAWSSFNFAGISITKTEVWGSYTKNGLTIVRTGSYGGRIINNYDVTASISIQQHSASYSSAYATFKTVVTVSRGFGPWGIYWSTRSGVQYVRGNTSGRVTAYGWM